jgi:uncharacterized OB-fold protein
MKNPVIYTFSILRSTTPAFIDRIPYVSAILQDETGTRFASLLSGYTDGMEVKIGQEVYSADSDKKGNLHYSLVR